MEVIGDILQTIFGKLPSLLFYLVKLILFLLLSIIVMPAMAIMLTLHGVWEGMLDIIAAGPK